MLDTCTFGDVKSLNDLIPKPGYYDAKVIKVYDGDTIWVAYYNANLGMYLKSKVRFTEINAAEIRGNKDESSEERLQRTTDAHRAKQLVEDLIGDKIILIELVALDKYSRMLCNIFVPREIWPADRNAPNVKYYDREYVNLSKYMLDAGYAVRYIN